MSLSRTAKALMGGLKTGDGIFGQARGMAGAPGGLWKADRIVTKEPPKLHMWLATALGATFWAHVTIRMYEDGLDKFMGHNRTWIADLENERVFDMSHDDLEQLSENAVRDAAKIKKWTH